MSWGATSRDVIINHGVPQGSPLSPILYLIFTHDLPPPSSKVFSSIFADDLKYFVAGPNLSIITTKLQQSMDDPCSVCQSMENRAERWQDFRTLVPALDPDISLICASLHGHPLWSPPPSLLASLSTPRISFTKHFHAITNLVRHGLLKLLSISTSTHGPSPSTTIRLFDTYNPVLY